MDPGIRQNEITEKVKELESRFFKAISNEDEESVLFILQDKDFKSYVNSADKLSLAFVQVVLLNSVNLLKILVENGADISCTDLMFEENGIMHATRYGHKEMLLYLLQAGVDVNHQSSNGGSTAIHVAVGNAKHECLEMLVQQKGIDLNIKDCSGYSPLLWTARLRDPYAMKVLIEAGCSIESKDFCKGVNALHVVVDSERAFWKGKGASKQDITRCIDLLIDAGVDINKGDAYGNPPLIYAIKSNNIPALKYLLKLNCSIQCLGSGMDNRPMASNMFLSNESFVGEDISLLPLYLAISKIQLLPLKILCAVGVKYHKLAREPDILNYCKDKYELMQKWLESTVFTPMSLKLCCRNEIRRHLHHNPLTAVDGLELPTSLRGFIRLDDLDNI